MVEPPSTVFRLRIGLVMSDGSATGTLVVPSNEPLKSRSLGTGMAPAVGL